MVASMMSLYMDYFIILPSNKKLLMLPLLSLWYTSLLPRNSFDPSHFHGMDILTPPIQSLLI